MWTKAQEREVLLSHSLKVYPKVTEENREYLHKRLDNTIDRIIKMRKDAKDIYPDVAQSFVVASIEI
jgi:hypothetical protein